MFQHGKSHEVKWQFVLKELWQQHLHRDKTSTDTSKILPLVPLWEISNGEKKCVFPNRIDDLHHTSCNKSAQMSTPHVVIVSPANLRLRGNTKWEKELLCGHFCLHLLGHCDFCASFVASVFLVTPTSIMHKKMMQKLEWPGWSPFWHDMHFWTGTAVIQGLTIDISECTQRTNFKLFIDATSFLVLKSVLALSCTWMESFESMIQSPKLFCGSMLMLTVLNWLPPASQCF